QITTTMPETSIWQMLFINTSKIQFESKSQPLVYLKHPELRCLSIEYFGQIDPLISLQIDPTPSRTKNQLLSRKLIHLFI
ncbi:MAG: hypothetical protein AAB221_16210, partial [Bacteroidota bacterium]